MSIKAIFYLFIFVSNINILYADDEQKNHKKLNNQILEDYYEDHVHLKKVELEKAKDKLVIDHFEKKIKKNDKKIEDKTDNKPVVSNSLSKLIHISKANQQSAQFSVLANQAFEAYQKGMFEVAEHLYYRAYLLNDKNISINIALADLYINKGLWKKAQKIYQDILEKHPENLQVLNNYMAVMTMCDSTEAIYELKRLETISPFLSIIPAHIGMAYYKNENYAKATKFLLKALKLEPDNNAIKTNLAISYEKDHRNAEAIQLYQELLESYNNGEKIMILPKIIVAHISKLSK